MSEKLVREANKAFEEWYSQGLPEKETVALLKKNHHEIYTLMKVYTDHMAFVAGYLKGRQVDSVAIQHAFMAGQVDAGIDPSFSSAKEYDNKFRDYEQGQ
jgi:hypothetical protein